MTTPLLVAQIKHHEGYRPTAYPDPLTHGAPYTIGYGHTGPDVHPGATWTPEMCEQALTRDIDRAHDHLDEALPWWRIQDDIRQDVLLDMTFNMGIGNGVTGLTGFHHFLNSCRTGQYEDAARQMLESRWAEQVGERAAYLAYMMRTGTRPATPLGV